MIQPVFGCFLSSQKQIRLYVDTDSTTTDKLWGGVGQWLGRQISDQGVPSSSPSRCTFHCGLEQVTFTLLSTG